MNGSQRAHSTKNRACAPDQSVPRELKPTPNAVPTKIIAKNAPRNADLLSGGAMSVIRGGPVVITPASPSPLRQRHARRMTRGVPRSQLAKISADAAQQTKPPATT